MKFFYILTLFCLASCNAHRANPRTENKLSKSDSLKTSLLGVWGGFQENSPVWEIKLDSIVYYQENKTYPYQIVESDLIIYRGESKGILKSISVEKDTLKFSDEQGLPIKGYRFKSKR